MLNLNGEKFELEEEYKTITDLQGPITDKFGKNDA